MPITYPYLSSSALLFSVGFPLTKVMLLFKCKFIENPCTTKLFSQASVALFSSIIQVILLLMS